MSAQNSTTEEKGITSPQLFASPSSQQSGTLTSEGGSQLSAYSKSKREAESEWVALSLANNGGSNNSSNGGGSGASGDKKKTTMRGWMKIRGVMKQWTIRLFDLRPPYLIYFKDEVDEMREDAVGIIDLKGCKVFERESKKDGFCFKISSLTSSTIYASRGLKNEILATKLAPMNTSIAILRVVTREEGFEWIKAISSAIDYANTQSDKAAAAAAAATVSPQDSSSPAPTDASTSPTGTPRKSKTSTSQKGGPKVSPQKSSSKQQPKKGDKKKSGEKKKDVVLSSSSSSSGGRGGGGGGESTIIPFDKLISFQVLKALVPQPTNYVLEVPREEMKVDAFEQGKSIILQLIKQVKPGMDLTKVTLPTHILEPRSFLEKMTDYFAHVELISQ